MGKTSFAKRLQEARRARKLTQSSLAAAAHLTSMMVVSRYERGVHEPRYRNAEALARALKVDVAWLLSGTGRGPRAKAA